MILDTILNETISSCSASTSRIKSENNDGGSINWVRGMSDPGEMIGCGAYQQLRRLANETDETYFVRLKVELTKLPQHDRQKIETAMQKAALQRANLFTDVSGKVCVVVANEPAWHGLGTNVAGTMTSSEALKLSGLVGWDLKKVEQQVAWDGRLFPVSGQYAILRPSDGQILGSVGERYEIFQNEQIFELLDCICEESGARYESAGALDNGSQVWALAHMPKDCEVAHGDELKQYIFFGSSHDGSKANYLVPTDCRTVCGNTYPVKTGAYYFRHTKNVKERAKQVAKALGLVYREQDKFAEQARNLVSVPLPDPREYFLNCLDSIVDVTIAGHKVTSQAYRDGSLLAAITALTDAEEKAKAESSLERCIKRRSEILADIMERHESERCNGMASISGSAWSAVNAVTEFVDHSPLVRYKGTLRERQEARFQSTLLGNAAELKEMALQQALALAN